MRRTSGIKYPKLRRKKEVVRIEGVLEPVRESIYDIVIKNLKIVNRVTYIHRIIYAAEHYFSKDLDALCNYFLEIINKVNDEYHLEKLTGFFLAYTKCFVHMVEGDEDSINKHLKLLIEDRKFTAILGRSKLIMCVHHIDQRFQDTWVSYKGIPSKLYETINSEGSLQDIGRYIYNCVKKMYNLVSEYAEKGDQFELLSSSSSTGGGLDNHCRSVMSTRSNFRGSLMSLRSEKTLGLDPYRHTLPEYEIVKLLIESKFTQTLQSYYELYRYIPQRDIYKDRVWPIPSDFIPYDVFSKPYDTVVELPRENREVPTRKSYTRR